MPKKIYYGNFQNKRKSDSKKRFVIMLSVVVIIGVIVWFTVFFGATGQKDVADAVKEKVQEITQLKLQLREKDDKIAQLEAAIAEYENELALRPTIEPLAIEPPNPEVLSGQPTPTPTPKPTKAPSKNSGRNNSNNSGSRNQNNSGQSSSSGQSASSEGNERTAPASDPAPANQDTVIRIGGDARPSTADNAQGAEQSHSQPAYQGSSQNNEHNSGQSGAQGVPRTEPQSQNNNSDTENSHAALPDAFSE